MRGTEFSHHWSEFFAAELDLSPTPSTGLPAKTALRGTRRLAGGGAVVHFIPEPTSKIFDPRSDSRTRSSARKPCRPTHLSCTTVPVWAVWSGLTCAAATVSRDRK